VEVPTVHGTAKLKIPAGTQAGERFTLRREGVPSLRGAGSGDMVVEVQVQTPTKLTKQQKELLKEFDAQYEEKHEEGFFSRLFHGHFSQGDKKQHAGDA
jgi:molecular chaperone DnaJ